ncbi:MAG: type II secretion system F family protein [Chloroflexota bacterium]
MELLIPVLIFGCVAGLVLTLLPRKPADLQARLGAYQYTGPLTERDVQLERSLFSRVVLPLITRILKLPARLAPQRAYEEARRLMISADISMDLNLFMGLRAVGIVAAPVLYVLLMGIPDSLMSLGLLGLVCWFGGRLPINWLRKKSAARQKAVQRALPDTLDLITVSVQAGLGLDAAMGKVVEKTRGPLRDEFGRVLQEVGLGKARRVALRDMANRCNLPDLNSFVNAIVQADQMGLGIAEVLRAQSDEVRLRRRQRAEETAMKAPVKMLFPVLMFIFPAMMSVLLGPAVYRIYVNIVKGGVGGF